MKNNDTLHTTNTINRKNSTSVCWAAGALLLVAGCAPPNDSAEHDIRGAGADSSITALHALDDRIRLLECRLLNSRTRAVVGEPPFSEGDDDDVLDYDEESIHHDEESIHHDEESIHHDEETIDHDEESIHHDEETIDHDEESIDHDEVFKALVACRRDTLEIRKKYLGCVVKRNQCVLDGGSYTRCNAEFRDCAEATRKTE